MHISEYKLLYDFQQEALNCVISEQSTKEKIDKICSLLKTFSSNTSIQFNISLILYAQKLIDLILKDDNKGKDLHFLAYNDTLTGLKNKNSLQEMLKTDIKKYYLLLLNVDNFSYINTAYGCDSGDVILIEIANKLKALCKHEFLYRINADEFGIVYKEDIDMVAFIKKIQKYFFENTIIVDNLTFHVTFTCGGAIGKYTLFKKATVALKEAKTKGNSKYKIYNENENIIEERQLSQFVYWNNIIYNAIENSLIIPFFQGIYNNKLNEISRYEALVRIKNDDGYYSPIDFLKTAKLAGLLPNITKIMIEKTFDIMSKNSYNFSVNITEEDLEQYYLLHFLENMSEKFSIKKSRVALEILENISSVSSKNHINQLNSLKKAGYKIAIDDFGTEYSNFERLLQLDVDFIKLDAKYIKNIDTDKKSQDIVEAIVFFAKRSNILCVAEFVHNKEVAKKIQSLGIEYSQGYYHSKPLLLPFKE